MDVRFLKPTTITTRDVQITLSRDEAEELLATLGRTTRCLKLYDRLVALLARGQ